MEGGELVVVFSSKQTVGNSVIVSDVFNRRSEASVQS